MDRQRVRRTEVASGDTIGVVLEPEGGSDCFAVVLGGSMGGIPEPLARRTAACGVTTFALGYFGAPGLSSTLVEVPLELPQRGIDLFRDCWANGQRVGLIGVSKGAELALLVASQLTDAVGPTVAISPSNVAWYGLDPSDLASALAAGKFTSAPPSVTRSSWAWRGSPWPFLSLADGRTPEFTDRGLRTDVSYDLARYDVDVVAAAQIPIERAQGPILLLSGEDDHQWPSVAMAVELRRRMERYGRSADLTNVVYPGAGHVFAFRDFMPPQTPFDFGGSTTADAAASSDAWKRIASFLRRYEPRPQGSQPRHGDTADAA